MISGIVLPADANWHHGGMHVSSQGKLVVACGYSISTKVLTNARYVHRDKKYWPKNIFHGRLMGGRCGATCLHVWDRHGKLVREDAVPGQCDLYGVGIDRDDNLYLMTSAPRMLPGKPPRPYFDPASGTLIKYPAGKGRVLTTSRNNVRLPLPESMYPKRPPDSAGGNQGRAWFVDASWAFGGVGFSGGNIGGCSCWNARFALDYLGRSFAPEVNRYSVAVLDTAGNVITRIGRPGNVDDGMPLEKQGGPPRPRSIGAGEVALFHAPYLATHTDRRLFIADPGNLRIVSVKLGYHASHNTPLKDVPDRKRAR